LAEDYRQGDSVRFCIRPHRVLVNARNGALKSGEMTLKLLRVVPQGSLVRLEFSGSITAHVPRSIAEQHSPDQEWRVSFAPDAIWVFPDAPRADRPPARSDATSRT
jgi:hypothetical protein